MQGAFVTLLDILTIKDAIYFGFIDSFASVEICVLTLFRMGFFGAAHGWGVEQKGPHSLKSVTYILQ